MTKEQMDAIWRAAAPATQAPASATLCSTFTGLESERRSKMIEVSKERFYSLIYEKRLNVHPRPEADKTYWEMQDGSRKLFGVSTPGYKEPDKIKTYKVLPDFEGGQ